MELKVKSAENYAGRIPQYSQPTEIGCYSINSNGKYRNDDHQLKYLAMPEKITDLCLNLSDGYSDYVGIYEDTEAGFSTVLRWILSHEGVVGKQFAKCDSYRSKIDFVCKRGLLSHVSSTIYEEREDLLIYATKFRSVIYMAKKRTDTIEMRGEKGRLMSTWGLKFEQYMTSDTVDSKPNTSVPVNENEKYYAVLKGKLDGHSILFAAETDGVDPDYLTETGHDPTSTHRYVELKTNRVLTTVRQLGNFRRYKLLKWYLQCYFSGIPRIICGFRDDGGFVRKLKDFNVRDIPDMAEGVWSAANCENFCADFLNFIKKCVMKDDPRVVYKIYHQPGSDITCEELDSDFQLLPDWYIERVTVI